MRRSGPPLARSTATRAADDKQLTKTIARYGRVDLLMIAELGYMTLDRRGAELLFQVLTEREEKNSIAIASNQSFSGWTDTFTDPPPVCRHRGPDHLPRHHHRNRHPLLPPRPRPLAARITVSPHGDPYPNGFLQCSERYLMPA
jgi:hypothetical protein